MELMRRLLRRLMRSAFWLASLFWKSGPAEPRVRRVVVLELTRLGDVVASTALAGPLAKAFPGADLEWWVREGYQGLFEQRPDLSVRALPQGAFGFFVAAWRARHQLRDGSLVLVSASPALRHSLLTLWSKPARAMGYLFPRPSDHGYLPAGLPVDLSRQNRRSAKSLDGEEHMVVRALRALSAAPIAVKGAAPSLVRSKLARKGVLIHPGANWSWRRWSLQRYADLAKALAAGGKAVSFVADLETLRGAGWSEAQLKQRCGRGVRVVRPGSLAAWVKRCAQARLFIGNDSGPLHVAAAAGAPCLALFGPNLPSRSGPWPLGRAGRHRVLEGEAPCRPCPQLRCERPHDWCMDKLDLAQVLATARRMLK